MVKRNSEFEHYSIQKDEEEKNCRIYCLGKSAEANSLINLINALNVLSHVPIQNDDGRYMIMMNDMIYKYIKFNSNSFIFNGKQFINIEHDRWGSFLYISKTPFINDDDLDLEFRVFYFNQI